jgi:hypothetical protein
MLLAIRAENRSTNPPTNRCFLAFSDYIAPQCARFARSFWPGFLFGPQGPEHDPVNWEPVFEKIMLKQIENSGFPARSGKVGPGFPARSRSKPTHDQKKSHEPS